MEKKDGGTELGQETANSAEIDEVWNQLYCHQQQNSILCDPEAENSNFQVKPPQGLDPKAPIPSHDNSSLVAELSENVGQLSFSAPRANSLYISPA